jgi:hypothetical protein
MVVWVLTALLAASPGLPVRREPLVAFAVDDALQAAGGVQYFFALAQGVALEFAPLGPPPPRPRPHVLMSRIVHTLEKDAGFFTAARVLDLGYINALGPGFRVSQAGPGRFHAARTPSNDFTVRFLDAGALAARPRDPAVDQVEALCGGGPDSMVAQHNSGFARVLGVRTAEASFTWTAHYRLVPGRTRVCVLTMSYLVNVPPFFLGGTARVHDESLKEALALIRAMRAYPAPPPLELGDDHEPAPGVLRP